MLIFVSTLLVFVASIKNGHGIPTSTVKSEKPLFVPSIGNPTVVHSAIYGTGRLESAAHYSPYTHNSAFYDSSDLLQRQPLYPPIERVLQILHHRSENRKLPENVYPADEDDYKRKSNNLMSSEQLSPELEDLDRKYKRSNNYAAWNLPTLKNIAANFEVNRAPTFNSRAADERPFGPYTTWSAVYEGPSITSQAGQKHVNPVRRRRHDSDGNDDIGENRDDTPSLLQYAPAYNTYTLLPAHLQPLHTRFVRDMPLQYSVVYAPAYPVGRKTSENLALLTNSLLGNPTPAAHADEPDKFASMY